MATKDELKTKKERYFESSGGRKTAKARARIFSSKQGIVINDKNYTEYFKTGRNQKIVSDPMRMMDVDGKLGATIKVSGGGINAQAEAVRNAIAKALVEFNAEFKKKLRKAGYITRDARMVERKKYGLKKARRAPQWKKR